jgi:integrase
VDSQGRRKWLGGYVREGTRGAVFIIERVINGTSFHVSTRCKTERAALRELERFEQDPSSYRPMVRAVRPDNECVVTPQRLIDFETYQLNVRKVVPKYAADAQRRMKKWMHFFAGRDIRNVTLRELTGHLTEDESDRTGRIVALKAFTKWLRRSGSLKRSEDPTLDLEVPRAKPAKLSRRKAVSVEFVRAAVPKLDKHVADLVQVMAATGLHMSEVRRFAWGEGGLHEPNEKQRAAGVLAFFSVRHKTGGLHVVAITDTDALKAAQAIQQRGRIASEAKVWRDLKAADAGFNVGSLRHSHATWLYEAGVSLPDVAKQLGHRDQRTTDDFYVHMGATAKVLPVPTLRLVKG